MCKFKAKMPSKSKNLDYFIFLKVITPTNPTQNNSTSYNNAIVFMSLIIRNAETYNLSLFLIIQIFIQNRYFSYNLFQSWLPLPQLLPNSSHQIGICMNLRRDIEIENWCWQSSISYQMKMNYLETWE